jgi:YVTN family beta-propeller protein
MRQRSGSRILAAVLFTDIVSSTAVATRIGDARWKELIARHHGAIRRELKRFGGRELDTAGDGFYASFEGPAAAIRCACAIAEAVRALGIEIRAGVHFGECERQKEKLGGIAVVVGARVMALAGPGEVLVTESTSTLVAGAGFGFTDRGRHSLKGVDGDWHVLGVVAVDGEPRPPPCEPEETQRRLAEVQPAPLLRRRWLASPVLAIAIAVVVVFAGGAIWISLARSGPDPTTVGTNSIGHINGDGSVDLVTALGQRPGASAIGFGSLWVAEPDRGVVARLSLSDGSVADPTIRVGTSPSGVAYGAGSIWVTNAGDGTVSRIDPSTNEVSQTLHDVGTQPSAIAFGDGALWVTDAIGARLLEVDPATGWSQGVQLAGQPSGVAFTPQGVWVSIAPAGVARVDPTDLSVVFRYQNVGNGPTVVRPAFGSIWVANYADGTVSRLDPATGRLQATIPVSGGPNALAVASGSLWVADEFTSSISAIDPATSSVRRTLPVGGSAASLTADAGGLWLAVGASAAEHRGGTLNVSTDKAQAFPARTLTSLDPGVVYDPIGWQILSITNDGLLAYQKVGGPDGATLVPDLASALPQVSADGLTYRFPLRSGIRYSDGGVVHAGDFRYALERALSLNSQIASNFKAIRGAKACRAPASSCDLSRGVVADGQVVTFHLTHPDPDLEFKLSLPPAFPVPKNTPIRDQALKPVPATGPYMVSSAATDHLTLVRNPEFHQWSAAAQPDGFVDRISWRFGVKAASSFERLRSGTVDWMTDVPRSKDLQTLLAAHPDQVVVSPIPSTFYVGMDLHQPPFNDKRVRRALNFAIDRNHLVDLLGGPTRVRLTCQILPPNFQGYQPYCPYTLDPESGVWSAPDLRRAQALVRAARVAGKQVTVWAWQGGDPSGYIVRNVAAMRYVVKVLNGLGLRAQLKVVPKSRYFNAVYAGGPQVYLLGWLADVPRASNFLPPQFRCNSGGNASGLCDRGIQSAMTKAARLQGTDPAAANAAWIRVEHTLVRDAVWAPLVNPVRPNAFSDRTHNVEVNPQWGILLSRLWVR